jgi:hypothetical protein
VCDGRVRRGECVRRGGEPAREVVLSSSGESKTCLIALVLLHPKVLAY